MLRTAGVKVSISAIALLFASFEVANARVRTSGGSAAVAAIQTLPRFDALITALQTPAAPPRPAKTSAVALPPGEGLETVKKLCSMCHGTDTFARQRHTRHKWNQIIDNMVSKGMEASDDDLEKMADYLGTNLGPDSPAPATGQPAAPHSAPKVDPQSR